MLRDHAPFGPYEIRRLLGSGAMGEVYLAFDTRLRREVAIKVLQPSEGGGAPSSERTLREARLAAKLRHPNICTVFEAGEIDGRAFIAMEYVVGRSVARLVEAGPLPLERVQRIGAQVADGLAAAHAQGIVHRDLKSANILVDADGRATILDFGIAARMPLESQTGTMTRTVEEISGAAGTLPYMAPEVLRGHPADARTDIWSLGVVLFEMTIGHRPFASTQAFELASAIMTAPLPEMGEGVPASLRAIVKRCLAREPAERYQRASELRAALEAAAVTGSEQQSVSPAAPRRRRWFAAAAASLLIAVAIVTLVVWRSSGARTARTGQVRSIAVLPLANLSGDTAQDFFADGMTEALITDLARVRGLDVISRSSVMQYKTAPKAIPEVARALGVDVVVEGSVIRSGDRVRITAQLIDGTSDRHLWANDYDRDVRDVLSLQHDVARAIATEIRATLSPADQRPAASRRIDPAAHDLYLRARPLILRYNEQSIAEAISLLQEALRIEPDFAEGWAALASAHTERGVWGNVGSRETAARAHEAITRALALDSNSAEAYVYLGHVLMVYDWDWAGAERAYVRGLDLAPGYGRGHELYGALMQATRRFDQAVAQADKYKRLDPASVLAGSNVGRTLYRAGRFSPAIDAFRGAISFDPTYGPNYPRLADVYIALGQYDLAIQTLDAGQKVGLARRQMDGYAVAYALSGRRREAEEILRNLLGRAQSSDQMAYSIAMVETALGDHDQAIAWLNRAFEQRSANLFLVNSEIKFDPLRSDPRFQDLLKRMGFSDSARTASRTAP